MQVAEERDFSGIHARLGDWRDLVAAADEADLFDTPEWQLSWLEAFWRDRPLCFRFVYNAGRLEGLLPLIDDQEGIVSCPRAMTLPLNEHVERGGLIARSDVVEAAARELLFSMQVGGGRVRLRLRRTLATRAGVLVEAARQQGLDALVRGTTRSPTIRIAGRHADYLEGRSGRYRHELERKRRRAAEQGRLAILVVEEHEGFARRWPDLLAIERCSWKGDQGSALGVEPDSGRFYRGLAQRCLTRGWLRLYLLTMDDIPAAYILGVQRKGVFYALKTSYDQRFARISPGTLLFGAAVDSAFVNGLVRFEILGEATRWKEEIATDWREQIDLCIHSGGVTRCQWCAAKVVANAWVGQHLPRTARLKRRLLDWIAR